MIVTRNFFHVSRECNKEDSTGNEHALQTEVGLYLSAPTTNPRRPYKNAFRIECPVIGKGFLNLVNILQHIPKRANPSKNKGWKIFTNTILFFFYELKKN